jgi:multimeric flavodoxin WrbA
MKVVAINGSPRKEGNTYHAIRTVFAELEKEGIETEIIHVGNQNIRGCTACSQCIKNKDEKCVITGDPVNEWIQKIKEADGIILGSPVYFSGIAGTMKSFLDRAFYVAGMNKQLFRHKVGAAVVAVRRSGGMPTFQQLNNYLLYSEMNIPTGNYWNVIHGTMPGDALKDEEGIQALRLLGKNMAWTLKLKESGEGSVEAPMSEKKRYTSFIR